MWLCRDVTAGYRVEHEGHLQGINGGLLSSNQTALGDLLLQGVDVVRADDWVGLFQYFVGGKSA